MDKKIGMNFSEYVTILSGNTDLLEKAKLKKQLAELESEWQAFARSKYTARYKLNNTMATLEHTQARLDRMGLDWENLQKCLQKNKDGSMRNLIRLTGQC